MKILNVARPPADYDSQEFIYNGMDCMVTKELDGILLPQVPRCYEWQKGFIGPTLEMMRSGIKIDEAKRATNSVLVQAQLKKYKGWWSVLTEALMGAPVNPNSSVKLKELFYGRIGIPEITTAKGGAVKVTCGREALEKIQKQHPRAKFLATLLLKIRDLDKVHEVLTKKIDPDGRWRFSINIAGTNTFRWSSSSSAFYTGSNIQNVDPALRDIFVADEGHTIVYTDLQGAEARGVAYLSGDESYIKAVESGDVHTMVSSMVFGHEPIRSEAEKEYTNGKTYRDVAKMCAHASNYLAKPRTIATQGGIGTQVAEDFQWAYFRAFPGIRRWQRDTASRLQRDGYLTNPLGYKRQFWDRLDADETLRAGLAFLPQSTISLIMSLGIQQVWAAGLPTVRILAPVHDALLWQCATEKLQELIPEVLRLLTIPFLVGERTLTIPVDAEYGPTWGKKDLKKWKSA